jgi:hypothetical protein
MLLIQVLVYGQNTGSISGKVTDNENNIAEFVNVFLTSVNDSVTILNGTVTDNSGSFILTNVPFGKYLIHFRFIGFINHRQAVLLNEENKNQELGTIIMYPDVIALNSVEITAFRNLIQKTEEGIVVNASENLTQIGGTAAELMKNMPGVQVDMEGKITLRGKTPLIMINGRISGVGGVDRVTNLEQIPASSIERVELITNPSAKYDADAESGIINVVLKNNTAARAITLEETGFVISTNTIIIRIFQIQPSFIKARPARLKIVPRVEAFVPVWIRLKRSGILTRPRLPRKINTEPARVSKAPIIFRYSIITPFLYSGQ